MDCEEWGSLGGWVCGKWKKRQCVCMRGMIGGGCVCTVTQPHSFAALGRGPLAAAMVLDVLCVGVLGRWEFGL